MWKPSCPKDCPMDVFWHGPEAEEDFYEEENSGGDIAYDAGWTNNRCK